MPIVWRYFSWGQDQKIEGPVTIRHGSIIAKGATVAAISDAISLPERRGCTVHLDMPRKERCDIIFADSAKATQFCTKCKQIWKRHELSQSRRAQEKGLTKAVPPNTRQRSLFRESLFDEVSTTYTPLKRHDIIRTSIDTPIKRTRIEKSAQHMDIDVLCSGSERTRLGGVLIAAGKGLRLRPYCSKACYDSATNDSIAFQSPTLSSELEFRCNHCASDLRLPGPNDVQDLELADCDSSTVIPNAANVEDRNMRRQASALSMAPEESGTPIRESNLAAEKASKVGTETIAAEQAKAEAERFAEQPEIEAGIAKVEAETIAAEQAKAEVADARREAEMVMAALFGNTASQSEEMVQPDPIDLHELPVGFSIVPSCPWDDARLQFLHEKFKKSDERVGSIGGAPSSNFQFTLLLHEQHPIGYIYWRRGPSSYKEFNDQLSALPQIHYFFIDDSIEYRHNPKWRLGQRLLTWWRSRHALQMFEVVGPNDAMQRALERNDCSQKKRRAMPWTTDGAPVEVLTFSKSISSS